MNAETERPEPQRHTFSITVDIDPRWVDYVTQHYDHLRAQYYAGYWARAVVHDPALGWLVAEMDEVGSLPRQVRDRPHGGALAGLAIDLPPRWYRLDRTAALRMWEEGVKRCGVDWYDDRARRRLEDVLLQLTLLGEVRYG